MHLPRWLDAALSLDGTLCTKERKKRELFFAINCLTFVSVMIITPITLNRTEQMLRMWTIAQFCVTSITGTLLVCCKVKLSTRAVVGVAYSYVLCIVGADLLARCVGGTFWTPLVLVVDLLLVMQVPTRFTAGLVCVLLLWLAVLCLEELTRFGLLDLPGLVPQDGENGRRALVLQATNCTLYPCTKPSLTMSLTAAFVFVIDFVATRFFAQAILKEQATMQRTISTVQEIASLLAGYDVEGVAEMLKVHEAALPEGMRDALQSIEENLRKYKAYLPQTCLPFYKDNESESECIGDTLECSVASRSTLPSMRLQPLGLSLANATLLTLNIKDTLRRLEDDTVSFSDLFSTLLLKTLHATETRRGMVDVFVGDRIHCSFNTSKTCVSHATSALHSATLLCRDAVSPHINIAIATGKVLRGDMGCQVMRRFSMVGTLVRDVNVLERVCHVLRCTVLCNRFCFSDAECEHHLRLVPCKVELAAGCEPEAIAELVVGTAALVSQSGDEWMYVIGAKKDWEDYNTAVRRFMKGESSAQDVAAEAEKQASASDVAVHVLPSPAGCDVLSLPVHKRAAYTKGFHP